VTAALGGALVLLLCFAGDLVHLKLDFMGYDDQHAIDRILHEYGGDVVRDQLALLAAMLVAGAAFGIVGGFIAVARARARDTQCGRGRAFLWGAGTAALGHALLFARHLVKYPQLYAESFYDRGGVRRLVMQELTRHTRPGLFVAIGLIVFVALLPLRRLSGIGRDGRVESMSPRRRGRGRALVLGAVGVIVLLSSISTLRVHHAAAPNAHPNVLLIAVDSLRADRVFGPSVRRFPTLRALAARSVRFRQDHVTVPRTFPSFVTLLTGRYPHHHGIRHMFPSAAEREHIGTSLPRALEAAGYHTAVVSDYAGEIFSRTPIGFRDVDTPRFDMHTIVALRGLQIHANALPYAAGVFDRFFPYVRAMAERADPALLADRADAHLRQLADGARHGQPFFATVFFSAAHFPYAAPYPYYERFVDPLYAGPFLYDKPPLSPAPVTPVDARHIQALYDGAVASVDDALARLLHELDVSGVADDTIVVVLADHGENLWEDPRAGMGHGDHLIGDKADHVPLLIFDPRHASQQHDVDSIVRDIDLAPTLAALCGVPSPPTDGVDLAPLLTGARRDLQLPAFSETEYWFVPSGPGFEPDERLPYPAITGATDLAADGDVFMRPEVEPIVIAAKHRALRLGDFKLVYRPTRTGVRFALYDLQRDPEERVDVQARFPERFALLREKLYAWLRDDPNSVSRGDFVVPK
jgi:arylsulfatase A-like enzyme